MFKVIAEIQDSNWTAFISGNLESHLNFVNQRYQAKAMYALPDSEVEVMEPTDSSDHRFISCALLWKDRFVGDILVLEYDQKFTERDLSVCAKMIDAIAYAITFHMDLSSIQESGEEELLSNLLNGNYVSADVITPYFFFHMRWGFNIMYFLEGEDMYTKYQLPKECPLFPKYDHIYYEADEIRTKDSNQKP